jgi:hypothetical protein
LLDFDDNEEVKDGHPELREKRLGDGSLDTQLLVPKITCLVSQAADAKNIQKKTAL